MSLVSVIVPVFNREQLLVRALESLRCQSFSDFEIIVVDDHSIQDIKTIAFRFSARYLKNTGQGVSAARNTGIRAASSSLIAFLDSDDEWVSTKLEKQVEYLKNNPECQIVHTNEKWIRNGALVSQARKHQKFGGRIFDKCTELCLIAPSSVLVRKDLFNRTGLFDEDFVVCEDFDLWLRIASQVDVGFLSEDLTIKHGGHDDQLSMQYHSMDLWRVRALVKHFNSPFITSAEQEALKESLKIKSQILLTGFKKRENHEGIQEIERYLKLYAV